MEKTFRGDFYKLLTKLKEGENFSFSRYSDGEMFILQNKRLVLGQGIVQTGDNVRGGQYSKQDHKDFDPDKHSFYRDKLIESYQFKKKNYFKGLSCKCCVGERDCNWMKDLYGEEDEHLTWANLWVNGNYKLFVEEFIPVLNDKKVIMVVNEMAKINAPFNLIKDFRVGYNCIVNDYGLVEEMKKWIDDNQIENHVFLFAASSLSCYLAHQLFEHNDKNTYVDIGTTMNHLMGMDINRGYLRQYHFGNKNNFTGKMCIW
jgi:hypothetical protein